MRFVLVDNLIYEGPYTAPKYDLQPHLGLLSLAAVVRANGHEPDIYDPKLDLLNGHLQFEPSLYQKFALRILERHPDVVGFTALGCNFNCVVKVADHIKRLVPELPVLLGGPHATILHREILERFSSFDLVVRNEAEQTLPPLLNRLARMDIGDLPGVSYRNRYGEVICNPGSPIIEELDELPVPAYDCYPIRELELGAIRVEAGRGCPFDCTFCSTASFFGRSYRLKSTARLLAEMDGLNSIYGFNVFKLNHDLFTVNRKKVVEFCHAMLERNYTWSCSARVDCVDPDLLELMWEAGCRDMYFGIEAGSARMQAISRKRLDLDLVEPTLDVTARLGIRTVTSFITGYPEEEKEDQDSTVNLAARLLRRPDRLNESQLHLLVPEPGTQLTAKYGKQLFYDGYITDFNFPRLESDDRSLLVGDPVIFANHHYFPSRLPRDRHVFVTSAWMALRKAGRTVMAYVLRAFNGTLSTFMDEAYDWRATRRGSAGPVSVEDIVAFLASAEERHRLEQRLQHPVDENRESKDDRERNQELLIALGLLLLSESGGVNQNSGRHAGVPVAAE
jgi:radical SAM superfamily enzyme YgiQ (UPF0313 family)